MTEIIVIKPGEITLKSRRVRKRFEEKLVRNIKSALVRGGIGEFKIKVQRGRILLETPEVDRAFEILKRIFGISLLLIARREKFKGIEDIVNRGEEIFRERVKGKKFAVRVKRTGFHRFRSMDVERALGGRLYRYSDGVDLTDPDELVELEVVDDVVYFVKRKERGAGGLPVGSEGKILLLFSGGFDSSVAFYLLMKRGLEVDLVSFIFGGESQLRQVLSVAKEIADRYSYGYDPTFYAIDFSEVIADIRKNVKESYRNIILKRQMLRSANALADEKGIIAVATGDSIGQVASQTFDNLVISSLASRKPIIRPVVALDKQEIVDIARKIGIYERVSAIREYCQITPRHPVTHATVEGIERQERRIDLDLPLKLVSKRISFPITKMEDVRMLNYQIKPEEIPEDAVIFDIRDRNDFEEWHIPGSINIDEMELYEKIGELDRERIYVVACYRGGRSMALVSEMRKRGLKAYSLKGGCEAYR